MLLGPDVPAMSTRPKGRNSTAGGALSTDSQARGAIPFYGDILGDWREEAMLESSDTGELRIYTTSYATDTRLYTLTHNPQYRNGLTVHGYKQSHLIDYYMGFSMAPPPAPNIRLAPRL